MSMANGLLVSFAERSVDDDGEEVREPLEITSAGEVVLQDDTETFLPEQNKAAVTATYCSAVKSGMSARFVHFFCNRPLLFAAVDTKKATRDQTVAEKRLFQRAAQAQVTLERWETASFPLLLTAGETGRCYRVNLKLCR
ncbi:MAG: hypothetical protein LBJ38_03295 [Oscillospiraceae bacterium]|nr:hypothetical protein [Oscillospiraceae bacterium]